VRVCSERLAEEPVRNDFNSHLCEKFSHVLKEVGDMESEWTLFKTYIVEAAMCSCDQRLVGAYHGGKNSLVDPAVWEAVKVLE